MVTQLLLEHELDFIVLEIFTLPREKGFLILYPFACEGNSVPFP